MTLVIGHKGAPTVEPENTVASFERARELGADGVELDVRRTADGHLAVWHDPVLADGRVLLEHPWGQLSDGVDDLGEVLDVCAGFRLVNVEIKNWQADPDFDARLEIADLVVAALAERSRAEREAFVVSCFHQPTLDRVRAAGVEAGLELRTGWLMWGVDGVDAVVAAAVERGYDALHPFFTAVTPELVEAAHAAGLAVHTWTCNDLDEVRRLADLGTDAIITDRPDAARAALNGAAG